MYISVGDGKLNSKNERRRGSKRFIMSTSFHTPHFGKYDTLIKYTIVPSIPLSIIAILSFNPDTWMTSEILL